MLGIASEVLQSGARFYWHLGDFRKITGVDEDIENQARYRSSPPPMSAYEGMAWDDFISHQISLFGKLPVYLAIGNHETASPKTREEYIQKFGPWLNSPSLRAQRLRDDPHAVITSYYHWIVRGIDFIALDNATPEQFDDAQLEWFEGVVAKDAKNANIHSIVVGMHEALPESIAVDHSMEASARGVTSGRRVYEDLLELRDKQHKRVYILASHSHYFAAGIFNTPYWKQHGGVLPGWIVGTAGALRYALPPEASEAEAAETNVYGYLLATVKTNGEIEFVFHRLDETDLPASAREEYPTEFIHWCFAENSEARH